jgi:hypothetical protein
MQPGVLNLRTAEAEWVPTMGELMSMYAQVGIENDGEWDNEEARRNSDFDECRTIEEDGQRRNAEVRGRMYYRGLSSEERRQE